MASTSYTFDETSCPICRVPFRESLDSDIAEVSKGFDRIFEYSEKRNDHELTQYLRLKPSVLKVHNSCRRNYTSKRLFDQKCTKSSDVDDTVVPQKSLRSSAPTFDWKINCFLCGKFCADDKSKNIRNVMTLDVQRSVLDQCKVRADAWGLEVLSRINACDCVRAEDAVYHKNCHRDFFGMSVYGTRGRPVDSLKSETFKKLCEWLEVNDCELLTLQDVVDKAQALVPNNDAVYTEQWLKKKLVEQYGDHIQFNEVRGRRNVICWKRMGAYIINQKWHDDNKEDLTEHIIVTAAKLLKATIREAQYETASYPTCEDIRDPQHAKQWMPSLLQVFLDHLISPEAKKVAVGHTIVQAVRPKTAIAPIPFALGVSVDHVSASRYLIDLLYRLGQSVSYDEVCRFKQSVTQCSSVDSPQAFPECFTQYVADNVDHVADNVDHDVCTLDGSGTLHAMGIISITDTCAGDGQQHDHAEVPVPRLKVLKSGAIAKLNRIPQVQ